MEDITDEDIEEAYESLPEEDKKELKEIGEELEKIQPETPESSRKVDDKGLKKRISRVCLKLIEDTPKHEKDIMLTSYIITGNFIWCDYGDELDDAVDIAGELELPEEHVSGDVFEMWEDMKKKFENYSSN